MSPEPDGDGESPPPDGTPPLDIDSAFAAIVAGWSAPEPGEGADPHPPDGPLLPATLRPQPPELAYTEDEDGYEPPEAPPIPHGDLVSRLAWAGVLSGPLFLLVAALAWPEAPNILIAAAVAGFVAGFVVLVSQLPRGRSDDDDNGAVV
jgi:hypothetical protein